DHAPGGIRRPLRAGREPWSHCDAAVRGGAHALDGRGNPRARGRAPDPDQDRGSHPTGPGSGRRAAVFVAGLSVLAALLAGLAPALQATGRFLPEALRSLSSRTGMQLGATW